jgi:ketosteroid isomerase-like protein
MTNPSHLNVVQAWFEGLNQTDLHGLLDLFTAETEIRNAANPPLIGIDAPQRLLEDFFARTQRREFKLLGVAEGDGSVFAHWEAELTFRAGAHVAGLTIKKPFTVTLRGVDRFAFEAGKIKALDIIHETTSVARAAREHA